MTVLTVFVGATPLLALRRSAPATQIGRLLTTTEAVIGHVFLEF